MSGNWYHKYLKCERRKLFSLVQGVVVNGCYFSVWNILLIIFLLYNLLLLCTLSLSPYTFNKNARKEFPQFSSLWCNMVDGKWHSKEEREREILYDAKDRIKIMCRTWRIILIKKKISRNHLPFLACNDYCYCITCGLNTFIRKWNIEGKLN